MLQKMKQSKVLLVFILLTLTGVAIYYVAGENSTFWKIWGVLDTSSAIALAVLAFMGYMEYIRTEDEISITFKIGEQKKDSGLKLLRKDLSRSEILGILGMIQKDSSKRFNIKTMKNKRFLEELIKLQKGKKRNLVIQLSEDEEAQFNLQLEGNK